MRPVALSQLAAWAEGRHLGADATIEAVGTDSRKLPVHALFVALRGENFDGHDFVAQAAANGAAALLLHHDVETELPRVLCADTEEALGEIAAGMQKGRPAVVVALTGSNGKTSVKTLVTGILGNVGRTYCNPGNRNNEIGLPLAVLDAPEDAQFAVYEMGAGKPGDIAYLASIVPPQVALVNNIAPAHMERMGSLLGIAETKGAIYEALPDDGIAVVNADDAFAPYFHAKIGTRRTFRFGIENDADVRASRVLPGAEGSKFLLHTPAGNAEITLPLPGLHNVRNALAASALALAAGAPLDAIVQGLHQAQAVAGRQVAYTLANGATVVDDSYNANPGSVSAAIATLASSGAEAWLVLGDMKELGPDAEALHAQMGEQAREARIARLWTVGPLARAASLAFGERGAHFDSQHALVAALKEAMDKADAAQLRVLVKGSRSSAMDQVVAALRGQSNEAAAAQRGGGEGGHAA
jgi:UDP-N-acetylmuramoyl-tripeptide--D-alanyl-D-alanine ligase